MRAEHLEFLVEEPSAEAFLAQLLPRIIGNQSTFTIHVHQGKSDLLNKLGGRLRGYAKWLPATARIVVLVDQDDDDCTALKERMEQVAAAAGLATRSHSNDATWRVVNRLAIEELEAWYFGEWTGVRRAFPRVPENVPLRAAFRESDNILGGTWEALERVFQNAGYFRGGLRKIEVATAIGREIDPTLSTSRSFINFRDSLLEAISSAEN